jgi:Flp pilus assembly pilin Flp
MRNKTLSDQRGQTTAEYALVLLVVAVVVGVFAAFVRGGGLDGFFQAIVEQLPSSVG